MKTKATLIVEYDEAKKAAAVEFLRSIVAQADEWGVTARVDGIVTHNMAATNLGTAVGTAVWVTPADDDTPKPARKSRTKAQDKETPSE